MKLTARPTFAIDDGRVLQFIPVKDVPGYTHRVIIDNRNVGFLAEGFAPNAKSARFYLTEYSDRASPSHV